MKRKIFKGIICGVLVLGFTTGCVNDGNKTNTNNNWENVNADLTVDESVSKTLNCSITEEYIKGSVYSTEIVLPNWNRYTFLKEYEQSGTDFAVECDNDTLQKTKVFNEDLIIHLSYSIDTYSVNMYSSQKERMTDSLLYRNVGKPTVYGDENGYWYAYMSNESNSYRENDTNYLHVNIYKDLDVLIQYNMKYMLEIDLDIIYMNDIGKARLDYLLKDIKQAYEEKHNIDLSNLTIDMIKQ